MDRKVIKSIIEDMKMGLIDKIKHNHSLMMLLCCGTPLIILLIAVYYFGISESYLYWFVLLLCPLMHLWMMKDKCEGKNI